jgi:hypothetical protein
MTCLSYSTVQGCHNGLPIVIHYGHDGKGAPSVRYTNSAGVVVVGANASNTVAGACPSATTAVARLVSTGRNFASGTFAATHDPDGNGDTWTTQGAGTLQSFTVSVEESGTTPSATDIVIIDFGATGRRLYLTKKMPAFTWSVSQDDGLTREEFDRDIRIRGAGNTAFTVIETEQT